MPKKRKPDLFNEEDQERQAIEFLRSRGYGVFKIGDITDREEAEAVKRLQAIGYKVEHIKDSLIKIDTRQISSVDDIVIYFHEMLRRHNKIYFDRNKLIDKEARAVDRSILNHLINWRVEEGEVSLQEAVSEVFIMIDVLFDKASEWNISVKSIGILSILNNKAFVLSLFREARLKQDAQLRFNIDRQIEKNDKDSYFDLLDRSREAMVAVKGTVSKKPRKIKT